MKDLESMISDWQQLKPDFINEDKALLNIKNESIMESILSFEKQEKDEKNKQIYSLFFLIVLTIFLLYGVTLTINHYIGFALGLASMGFAIIANRTDDFPDVRLLATKDYLLAMKADLKSRRRRHIITTAIGLALAAPAVYLTFSDSFELIGDWWMPICFTSWAVTTYFWFKHYDKRSTDLNGEVDAMLEQL